MKPSPQAQSASTSSHPAQTLLSRAHSPTATKEIFVSKIKNKPLLLNPTVSDKRALRRHVRDRRKEYFVRKRKPQPLSAKEKRQLGVYELRKEEIQYDLYKGINQLWQGYMLEILGFTRDGKVVEGAERKCVNVASQGGVLASADFHGAELEVVRCRDPGRVGTKGIVVRDTKFAFVLVTAKDEAMLVPKGGAVFRYEVPLPGKEGAAARKAVLEVQGSQFEFRPAERANRKFKWKARNDI